MICINITNPENEVNVSCVDLQDKCVMPMNLHVESPGFYSIHLQAANDVSLMAIHVNATVHTDGRSNNSVTVLVAGIR